MPTYDPYNPLAGVGSAIAAYGMPPSDESPRVPLGPFFAPQIDPPPPYAADVETAAIDALGKLNPEQAARVIAWACSRFGVPGAVVAEIGKAYRVSKRQEKIAAERRGRK